MEQHLFFVLIITITITSEVLSCNTKHQFNSENPTQKPSLHQSFKDIAHAQKNNKETTTPKTVVLYGKAQEHAHSLPFLQHPFQNEDDSGKDHGIDLFSGESPTGFKGSSFQYNGLHDIKTNYGSGANSLFKTPLANDYQKGPGYKVHDSGPDTLFKNSIGNPFNIGKEDNRGTKGSFFGSNNNNGKGYTPFPLNNGISVPLSTHHIPEHHKGIESLPKPQAQKNSHNGGNIKEINGQFNYNDFNLFNNPSEFDHGNNHLDFNDGHGRPPHFNSLNGPNGNAPFNLPNHPQNIPIPHHQPQQAINGPHHTSGFYSVNEPSGSWRNINYNSGPTGFYANVQQNTNHNEGNSPGQSYGSFKTFGTIQKFGY